MRLRPKLSQQSRDSVSAPLAARRLLRFLRVYVYSVGVIAVEGGYWSVLFRNVLTRIVAFLVRGLRVRVEKVRIWKDAGSWEFKAEQFVFSGRAAGVFGSRYMLSVNELDVSLCKKPTVAHYEPFNASLSLKRGVEIIAFLTPRFFTLFRPRRMAIMDDLKISLDVRDITCVAPKVLNASIDNLAVELCPGYTRKLAAKLPPIGPLSNRRRKPGAVEYWEASGSVSKLSVLFKAPVAAAMEDGSSAIGMKLPTAVADQFASIKNPVNYGGENGLFTRIESVKVDAYGKEGDERHESMTRASLAIRGCSAGSMAVDLLSHALYESMGPVEDGERHDEDSVENIENIDKIVTARPEALVWTEDLTAAVDLNCSMTHFLRIDVAGHGGIVAIEPVGLASLLLDLKGYISSFSSKKQESGLDLSLSSSKDSENDSLMRRKSSSMLLDGDPRGTRFVADMRHWTFMALGKGPVGDGDTMAIVMASRSMTIPQFDLQGGSLTSVVGQVSEMKLIHWSEWARTTNAVCKCAEFEIHQTGEAQKKIKLTDTSIDWDLDVQSGLQTLPRLFASLKKLKSRRRSHTNPGLEGVQTNDAVSALSRSKDMERATLAENELRDRRQKRHKKLVKSLGSWELSGSNITINAIFPDGPKMGMSMVDLPSCNLSTESILCRDVVLTMQDQKVAYGGEFRLRSPLHTMKRDMEKRKIDVEVNGLCILLPHDMPFGFLLQDWLLRLRSVLKVSREERLRRKGLPPDKQKKQPLPDIYFKSTEVEVYFEDHPVGGFLTRMLPLLQDETRERLVREQLMVDRIQQLQKIARAEIAGTAQRCLDELKRSDSEIWVRRVQKLKEALPIKPIANGYLPTPSCAPATSFTASSLSFGITMDDLVREHGSRESIRRMKMYDDYELGPKKYKKVRQHDSDAWNSIGFRTVDLEATGVRLQFRDYPVAFVVIDRMRFDKTVIGQAVQATLPPYVSETTVAIGRRRGVNVVKGLGPTKTYADIHLVIDTLQCGYNPAYMGSIGDFSRGISRFFAGGKNPSPRIPWFDNLRVNMHGRMRITARRLKGHLTSSISPYSLTNHYVKVDADGFEMLASRLEATKEDPFPICWKLRKWKIRPTHFDENHRSEVRFDFVRVGLNPVITNLSGDPQDHYFVPFPTKEQIAIGGPGIGRGSTTLVRLEEPVVPKDNGFGNYTEWRTGLHDIPGADSFADFKTRKMILGIDICVEHSRSARSVSPVLDPNSSDAYIGTALKTPVGASLVFSDAITTLTKVIKKLIRRPISCRLPPRRGGKQRKPPSKTGLSSTLVGLDLNVKGENLNVMLYNNLEPGHGLFLSVASVHGELHKRTTIERLERGGVKRTSRLTRRRFSVTDIYSGIRVPKLDMAGDVNDMGKLLTVDKISLSDDPREELKYMASPKKNKAQRDAASGFGDDDLNYSPFYTFSANHPLQRGAKLDKVTYDKRLLVDRVRLMWSPARRASVFAWPDAFKEKIFCMRGPKVNILEDEKLPQAEAEKSESDLLSANGRNELDGTVQSETIDTVQDDDGQSIPDLNISETRTRGVLSENSLKNPSQVRQHQEVSTRATTDISLHSGHDPLSPPLISLSRSKLGSLRRPTGSMVDLLSPYDERDPSSTRNFSREGGDADNFEGDVRWAQEVLKSSPKMALYINDCQVAFSSPETSGTVFLCSDSVRVGIVDKEIQKSLQFGKKTERWSDREYRFHLNAANLYSRSKSAGEFDFDEKDWIPRDRKKMAKSLALVTRKPICMDLMYISSSSTPNKDGEEDDHILRPSLLFINVPDISMSTSAAEFHAVVDVVRKVLMQSMRSSEIVNEELANLRYKLQLAGCKVSSDELDDVMRRLNNVTKQFLYAGDTFQEDLVSELLLPHEENFSRTLQRYKAKAKAVATFMRQDQKSSSTDVLYPTMYVSYSFDKCSWELRETHKEGLKQSEHPFVELTLHDLVCRHIFYIGRGSSTEMTFANINAQNKIKSSYFQRILQPASTGANRNKSRIKASDGAPVAFRWYSKQDSRVGGISVYELLTIQVAPMTAALTRKLWSSVSGFIFSARAKDNNGTNSKTPSPPIASGTSSTQRNLNRPHASSSGMSSSDGVRNRSSGELSSGAVRRNMSSATSAASVAWKGNDVDDVTVMARRGETTILFKYIFIDAFELTASFKNKENTARGMLDVFDLFVTTPSFSYSSQVWTWKALATQIRKDLLMTFAKRGVSNLAKTKLLPGYSRARRRLAQHTDRFRESLANLVPSGVVGGGDHGSVSMEDEPIALPGIDTEDESMSEMEEGMDTEGRIDQAIAEISTADGGRRAFILKALYGEKWGGGSGVGSGLRPPVMGGTGGAGSSTTSRGSRDEEWRVGMMAQQGGGRARLFRRLRRKAVELKEEVRAEYEEMRRP